MPGPEMNFDTRNNDHSYLNAYNLLVLLTGLAVIIYVLARYAESKNRLNYDNRFARIIAGSLVFIANKLHTTAGDLEITNTDKKIVAIGPHRTGWEAVVVASKMKGTPPRFFATDAYNAVPGVASFMKMFKTIPIAENATKSTGRSANAGAIELASQALVENGCVALFPQGNFAKLDQDPPRVYTGAAQLSLKNKTPIHVVRLDGFWSLQNPIIPLFVRNNAFYRAFFSALHMNNVRATLCCVIDFHLKPDFSGSSDEETIREICAQLYAYYRHTKELTIEDIDAIKTEITSKSHLRLWDNKVRQDDLTKQLTKLKEEAAGFDKPVPEGLRVN